jgi:DNA-binding transcriptional ArsR family regulator
MRYPLPVSQPKLVAPVVSVEPELPDIPARLLATLREPRRLRILLALEHRPRSAADLARDLKLSYQEVHWALKELRKGGLVAFGEDAEPRRPGRGADQIKVCHATHTGWWQVVRALQSVAETSQPDA